MSGGKRIDVTESPDRPDERVARRSFLKTSVNTSLAAGLYWVVPGLGSPLQKGQAGRRYPPEGRIYHDRRTGAEIRQITDSRCVNHHLYLFAQSYDDPMERLIFVSHRTGRPEIFAECQESRELIQLTDFTDISEWSVYPSHDGRYVYFLAGTSGWRVTTDTFEMEHLINFGDVAMREEGMVAAALGTTGLSYCDRWWAIPVKVENESRLVIFDTQNLEWGVILTRDTIGHPQFCPDDSDWILYAGPLNDRTWVVHRDGSENRRLYRRKPAEWIAHEVWLPKRKEVSFVDWPKGIRAIQVESGRERRVTRFSAWHAMPNRQGTQMVADTNFPDLGLKLFDPLDGVGKPTTLCYPEASSIGEHWDGPFPYANGPIAVYAPQYTHPHPQFSPDGTRVVYTSDRSGFPQVYEVRLRAV